MADASSRQQALVVLETYQRQLDAVARQIEFLQGVHDEAVRALKSLEGLADEASTEILLPLGASNYIRAQVTEKDKVITSIGAGYATEFSRDAAIQRLEKRAEEVQQELDRLMQGAVQIQQEAARIQEELEMGGEEPDA